MPFTRDQSSPSSSEGLTTRFSACSSPGENDRRGECIIAGEGGKRGILRKVKMGKALQIMRNKGNAHQEQTYRSMQA